MTAGRFFLLLILIASGATLAIARGWLEIPPAYNPWAPLDLKQPPNLLTGFKLRRLQAEPQLCAEVLKTSTLQFKPIADSLPQPDCPIENAVRIQASEVRFNGSFLATCQLAVAYALFERHDLQPAAQAVYGQPVARIEHYGSYACRNIGSSNRRSQHASANALDIAGFHLADGTRVTLARDWQGSEKEQRFLREVRKGACRFFNATLGPDYNAAHRDHFHLDMGRARICR
jgi:hypothetical protein